VIKRAAGLAAAAEPAADLRGSVEYKTDLVRVLTRARCIGPRAHRNPGR
jgi:CO/xanthine dehydrogenase FAD-binding subunit